MFGQWIRHYPHRYPPTHQKAPTNPSRPLSHDPSTRLYHVRLPIAAPPVAHAPPLATLLCRTLLPLHTPSPCAPPSSFPPQYPSEIPGYESEGGFFAENMLPEGAHNHEEDWTVFFLNRDVENTVGGPVDVTA